MRRITGAWRGVAVAVLALLSVVTAIDGSSGASGSSPQPPNILFVILDDVGMDQMAVFGFGGEDAAPTPTLAALADSGVRFDNAWSMPACSTSRAVMFTGRFPLRTGVLGALGPGDLANAQVGPFEMTTPLLLRQEGYRSALFGKFHLGLQGHNPYGEAMPASLGWDYFAGWLDETGDPPSTDTTAGGVAPPGAWTCGFIPGSNQASPTYPSLRGADQGACYAASGSCREMSTSDGIPPGRSCRDSGGIFDPWQACQSPMPANLDFTRMSGHYVSPYVINRAGGNAVALPPTDLRARTFRGTVVVDEAIDWIERQPEDRPWMATVSFASNHTPLMQPPADLLSTDAEDGNVENCFRSGAQKTLMNQMLEAIDAELGRLLESIGAADRGRDGRVVYRSGHTDTMVIVVGDNGSLGTTVRNPFDASRAKGTAYQTGVWVPLLVAGPLVSQPGRTVGHMVSIADLFSLFGEIAGIDVPAAVERPLDAVAMLPYLVDPGQAGLRKYNFAQVGPNQQAGGALNAPCTIANSCTQIPVTESVCRDNGGTWWGPGAPDPSSVNPALPPGRLRDQGLQACCQVNVWITEHTPAGQSPVRFSIQPLSAVAIRDDRYKIVRNTLQLNDPAYTECLPAVTTDELYAIDQAAPRPALDTAGLDLMQQAQLTAEQQASYEELSTQLAALLASAPECPGDGNRDGRVDGEDVAGWREYSQLAAGGSSWFDVNFDGLTDRADLAIIQQHLRSRCEP